MSQQIRPRRIARQVTEAFPWNEAPRYLIRDRDCDKRIASGSPWQNGFAERLIGLIRRECIGHVIVWAKRTYAGF